MYPRHESGGERDEPPSRQRSFVFYMCVFVVVVVCQPDRQAFKAFERALLTSLEDPKYGIGSTRELFEHQFKGSIGSGASRTAM